MPRSLIIAFLAVPYACAHGIAQPTEGSCPAGGCVLEHGAASTQVPADDPRVLLQVDVQTQSARGSRDSTRTVVRSATAEDYPCGARQQGEEIHKPLVFLHIHKAGGTIMCSLAMDNGEVPPTGPFTCCQNNTIDGYAFWERINRDTPYTCEDRCRDVAMGGITYEGIEHELKDQDFCPAMFDYATVLRDPLSLMQSSLNYEAAQPLASLEPWNPVDAPSMKERMVSCLLDGHVESCQQQSATIDIETRYVHFDNYMVRVLGGPDVLQLPPRAVNATHLKKALDVLAQFRTVLRFEDLWAANNTDPLRQAFGWTEFSRLSAPAGPVWGAKVPDHPCTFSDQERAGFEALNKYDYELYNSVRPS